MPKVSIAFFLAASIFGLGGMAWGGYMGALEDFTWRDAHAHLNLVGWTTLALMGSFYALSGAARPKLLSWVNFSLSTVGVVIFVPGLAMIASGAPTALGFVIPGSVIVMLGMATFLASVVTVLVRKPSQ